MKSEESSSDLTQSPGYLLQIINQTNSLRSTSRLFWETQPLAARQACFQGAQHVVANKQPNEVLDVIIDFVLIDRTAIPSSYETLATVFSQRFCSSTSNHETESQLIEMEVDPLLAASLPASLVLTMQIGEDDETISSPKSLWNVLGGLTCEREYYLGYGCDMGLGTLQLEVSNPQIDLPLIKELVNLSEVEMKAQLTTLNQQHQRPFRTFYILYDGLGFAALMISYYNHHCGPSYGQLSFTTEFLPQ